MPILLRPKSRGYIELKSSNPEEPPKIEPNYLSQPHDLKVLVAGENVTRDLLSPLFAFVFHLGRFFSPPFRSQVLPLAVLHLGLLLLRRAPLPSQPLLRLRAAPLWR